MKIGKQDRKQEIIKKKGEQGKKEDGEGWNKRMGKEEKRTKEDVGEERR